MFDLRIGNIIYGGKGESLKLYVLHTCGFALECVLSVAKGIGEE